MFNKVLIEEMDNTHITGSKLIDTCAVSLNIIKCIEECKLMETNDIIIMDHRAYIIDINFKRYFQAQLSIWDQIN